MVRIVVIFFVFFLVNGTFNIYICDILHKAYKVETRSYPISNRFAEKIYEEMVSTINNFKAKSVSMLVNDGYSVTFRTVVEDEVWTLNIHMPQGDALKMADLCRQIMADADADKLNSEY